MNGTNAWRYTFLGITLSILPLLILLQLVRIQTNPEQQRLFKEQRMLYEGQYRTVYPARGQIYDRWGHLLAGNKVVYEVGVELQDVVNPHTIALTLNVVLGTDYAKAFAAASMKPSSTAIYAVIEDYVEPDKIKKLFDMKAQMQDAYAASDKEDPPSLRGLVAYPHLARSYPEKALGSNLLGFVSREGKGYFGVEEKYNELLAGTPRSIWLPNDPTRAEELPTVPDGASLVLTIDRTIQGEIEKILDDSVVETGSTSGTIVVINPKTGELIAMATQPRIDLNDYTGYFTSFSADVPFNRIVSQSYEPGSVYKVLTMAAGLDSGTVEPGTTFIDTGVFEIGGTYIYNWNQGAWGPQKMQGCLQHSLNVCMAWIASKTGAKTFYAYMQAFGIGRLTGIDLAGEAAGRLKMPGDTDWYDADLGTNAFGQGVAATPLQMASSISALANDGKLMAPHVVRSLINKGYQYDIEQRVVGMPIKTETARVLTDMLANSLETESSDALVTGYRVAGKTGTAEIPTPFGYTSNQTNASFVGWGPADDPQFLVYIWLEKPESSIWGSIVAAPVFREVVEHLVVLLDIPPDDTRHRLLGQAPAQ